MRPRVSSALLEAMVRSPAAASRKRRIDSSSAEIEEQPATSPRKSNLRRVSVLSPSSSTQDAEGEEVEEDEDNEEEQPALEAGDSSASASKAGSEEDNEEDEERYKVWKMFADQYHDSELRASPGRPTCFTVDTLSGEPGAGKLTIIIAQSSSNSL